MLRRNFLRLGVLTTAVALSSTQLSAIDFRSALPDTWTASTVDEAIIALYGTNKTIHQGVTLTTPDPATNSGSVPLNVKSDIQAQSLAIFQDANPEATVAVFTVHENTIIDYDLKIKLQSDGTPITITAIVEGIDGQLYSGTRTFTVALGTCDG